MEDFKEGVSESTFGDVNAIKSVLTTGGTAQDWIAVAMLFTPAGGKGKNTLQNNITDTPNSKKTDTDSPTKPKTTTFAESNTQYKKGEAYADGGDTPIQSKRTSIKLKLKGIDIELDNIITSKFEYTKRNRIEYEKLRKEFGNSVRGKFLKSLAKNKSLLESKGLSEIDIQKMEKGICPNGYQVHHKYPLDDGGTNDFDNLVLIKNDPYHKALTNYQKAITTEIKVDETKLVDWYTMQGSIYP